MAAVLVETVSLAAGAGLRFLDAWSGQPVAGGLRCTLRRKRDGLVLAAAAVTPSGIHHWPGLRAPWSGLPGASPPSPPQPALAEVLVEDLFERFLPLRLDWPPEPDQPGGALATITLLSAPQRAAPPGSASVAGLLAGEDGTPAAWARLLVADTAGARTIEGMSDGAGRFTVHLPLPRPERRPAGSPPGSPPAGPDARPIALVTLRVFHDPGVAADAGVLAPHVAAWRAQPEVRALARLAPPETLGTLGLEAGRATVARTEGLPPDHSELRLAPR